MKHRQTLRRSEPASASSPCSGVSQAPESAPAPPHTYPHCDGLTAWQRPDAGLPVSGLVLDDMIASEIPQEVLPFDSIDEHNVNTSYNENDILDDEDDLSRRIPIKVSLSDIDIAFDPLLSFIIRLILAGSLAALFVAVAFATIFAAGMLLVMYLAGR